jgi:hypothetical protein
LAQRAYRERKESAIEDLKRRIIELEQLNESMGREYTTLTDAILNQASIQCSPDVAQQIKDGAIRLLHTNKETEEKQTDSLYLGPLITQQTAELPYVESSSSAETSRSSSPPKDTVSNPISVTCDVRTEASEALTQPYPSAVSSWPSASQAEFLGQQYLGTGGSAFTGSYAPAEHDFYNSALPGSLYGSTLRSPRSYAANETTFGRRLHRASQEGGSLLASMKNPPPLLYMKVFGFCLHLETRQQIATRMRVTATRARDETLNYWNYPFTNLGGAGQFFTNVNGSSLNSTAPGAELPIGNRSLPHETFKPHELTGLSMGPFSEEVEAVRDLRLNAQFRILEPTFQGDFFDSDEIEICLRGYGVAIPPAKDYVTAYIDMAIFETPEDYAPQSYNMNGLPVQTGLHQPIPRGQSTPSTEAIGSGEHRGTQLAGNGLEVPDMPPSTLQYPDHTRLSGNESPPFQRSPQQEAGWNNSQSKRTKVTVDVEGLISGKLGKASLL